METPAAPNLKEVEIEIRESHCHQILQCLVELLAAVSEA